MAAERERADVRQERDEWCKHRQPAMQESPGRLVFVDETSVKTNMTPLRGRSRKGERLQADAPFGKWEHPDLHRRAALRRDHSALRR